MTVAMSDPKTICACHSIDAYDCWASRYGLPPMDPWAVVRDGGPCMCACHDEEDDEYDLIID